MNYLKSYYPPEFLNALPKFKNERECPVTVFMGSAVNKDRRATAVIAFCSFCCRQTFEVVNDESVQTPADLMGLAKTGAGTKLVRNCEIYNFNDPKRVYGSNTPPVLEVSPELQTAIWNEED